MTSAAPKRLLITAGPTHEPIDAVRYLGNRSSGRLGIALAETAARRGYRVTLLLGPTPLLPHDTRVDILRFRTTADLQALLAEHFPTSDILIMAAAVADYRPVPHPETTPDQLDGHKLRRTKDFLTLHLEPTPDLLAGLSVIRTPDQTMVGFALEPESRLIESATNKLARKGLDMIVANALETMDAQDIRASLMYKGSTPDTPAAVSTPGRISKHDFAPWLLDRIEEHTHSPDAGPKPINQT